MDIPGSPLGKNCAELSHDIRWESQIISSLMQNTIYRKFDGREVALL